jgi:hypothetical protein
VRVTGDLDAPMNAHELMVNELIFIVELKGTRRSRPNLLSEKIVQMCTCEAHRRGQRTDSERLAMEPNEVAFHKRPFETQAVASLQLSSVR